MDMNEMAKDLETSALAVLEAIKTLPEYMLVFEKDFGESKSQWVIGSKDNGKTFRAISLAQYAGEVLAAADLAPGKQREMFNRVETFAELDGQTPVESWTFWPRAKMAEHLRKDAEHSLEMAKMFATL